MKAVVNYWVLCQFPFIGLNQHLREVATTDTVARRQRPSCRQFSRVTFFGPYAATHCMPWNGRQARIPLKCNLHEQVFNYLFEFGQEKIQSLTLTSRKCQEWNLPFFPAHASKLTLRETCNVETRVKNFVFIIKMVCRRPTPICPQWRTV